MSEEGEEMGGGGAERGREGSKWVSEKGEEIGGRGPEGGREVSG